MYVIWRNGKEDRMQAEELKQEEVIEIMANT